LQLLQTLNFKQLFDREQALKGVTANFDVGDADHQVSKSWDAETLLANLHQELSLAEIVQTEGDTEYDANKKGEVSVSDLDSWGRSRRMRRLFNRSTAVDLSSDPQISQYPDRTLICLRNINTANGINLTHGKTTVLGNYANGKTIDGNPAAINIQPGEICCFEIDEDTIYVSIFPAERVLAFVSYAEANNFGAMPHDSVVIIRNTKELWVRATGVNNVVFPSNGEENTDWFKVGNGDNLTFTPTALT